MESDPRTRRRRRRRRRRLAQAPDDRHACDFVFVPDRRTDEYFTLTIGGPATILNNSKDVIHAGDTIAWTFYSEHTETAKNKRANHGSVRRIGIRIADLYAIPSVRTQPIRKLSTDWLREPLEIGCAPTGAEKTIRARSADHVTICVSGPRRLMP